MKEETVKTLGITMTATLTGLKPGENERVLLLLQPSVALPPFNLVFPVDKYLLP